MATLLAIGLALTALWGLTVLFVLVDLARQTRASRRVQVRASLQLENLIAVQTKARLRRDWSDDNRKTRVAGEGDTEWDLRKRL